MSLVGIEGERCEEKRLRREASRGHSPAHSIYLLKNDQTKGLNHANYRPFWFGTR